MGDELHYGERGRERERERERWGKEKEGGVVNGEEIIIKCVLDDMPI